MPNYLNRKGSRLEKNKVILSQTKNGQFHITIPIEIARTLKLKKGSIMTYELKENKIILTESF